MRNRQVRNFKMIKNNNSNHIYTHIYIDRYRYIYQRGNLRNIEWQLPNQIPKIGLLKEVGIFCFAFYGQLFPNSDSHSLSFSFVGPFSVLTSSYHNIDDSIQSALHLSSSIITLISSVKVDFYLLGLLSSNTHFNFMQRLQVSLYLYFINQFNLLGQMTIYYGIKVFS